MAEVVITAATSRPLRDRGNSLSSGNAFFQLPCFPPFRFLGKLNGCRLQAVLISYSCALCFQASGAPSELSSSAPHVNTVEPEPARSRCSENAAQDHTEARAAPSLGLAPQRITESGEVCPSHLHPQSSSSPETRSWGSGSALHPGKSSVPQVRAGKQQGAGHTKRGHSEGAIPAGLPCKKGVTHLQNGGQGPSTGPRCSDTSEAFTTGNSRRFVCSPLLVNSQPSVPGSAP